MDRKAVKIRFVNLSKSFFQKTRKETTEIKVVDDISLDVYDNEFLVILGPGHCGKTVLLNMIAGLETPSGGSILLDGEEIVGNDRRISMVFQKWSLLPWKTVMQNVEIGPKFRGVDKRKRRETAQKNLDLVGLQGFEKAYPSQLSGGMKQRVGIARAYTNDPEVLLMDEPFGALDAQTRLSMEQEIERIWNVQKRTIVFVTNNIDEAIYLGDRIVLLSQCPGKIKKIYENLLPRPRDMVSEDFLRFRKEIFDNSDLVL